jgi:hypothetical protein
MLPTGKKRTFAAVTVVPVSRLLTRFDPESAASPMVPVERRTKLQRTVIPPEEVKVPIVIASVDDTGDLSPQRTYFPYPYDRVHFSYTVPDSEELTRLQSDSKSSVDRSRAIEYFNDLKSRGINPRSDQSVLVYPNLTSITSADRHNNFLYWVKILQYVRTVPSAMSAAASAAASMQSSSSNWVDIRQLPFTNFYPGNPQQLWNHLTSTIAISSRPPDPYFQIVPSSSVLYDSGSSIIPRVHIPLSTAAQSVDYLDLGYPQYFSTLAEAPVSSQAYYCGGLQEAWELGVQRGWAGSFDRCRKQFDNQLSLLSKVEPEQFNELIAAKAIQLEMLQREIEAINWLSAMLSK